MFHLFIVCSSFDTLPWCAPHCRHHSRPLFCTHFSSSNYQLQWRILNNLNTVLLYRFIFQNHGEVRWSTKGFFCLFIQRWQWEVPSIQVKREVAVLYVKAESKGSSHRGSTRACPTCYPSLQFHKIQRKKSKNILFYLMYDSFFIIL
jgi:hypothetical protein